MAWQGTKTIRLVPDQQGKGGSKTSLTTQSINLDIRLASNVFVTYGRWRQSAQAILAEDMTPVLDVAQSYALHNFARFDTSNATLPPEDRLLSHNRFGSGTNEINQHNPPFTVKVRIPPPGVQDCVPATFANIKNRCFICWGGTPNFIYTGKVTYDVGVDPPVTAATYTLGDSDAAFVIATAGNTRVTYIGLPGVSLFTNDDRYITIDGTTYPLIQPNPLDNGPFATPGTATGTSGSPNLTINGGLWPLDGYQGLTLSVDGNDYHVKSYTLVGPDTNVILWTNLITSPSTAAYTVTGSQLILAQPFNGVTTSTLTDTGFGFTTSTVATFTFGPLSWDTPPQYAYAYYDYPGFIEGGTASGTIGTNQITINGAIWGPLRYEGVTITLDPGGTPAPYTISSYTTVGSDTVVTITGVLAATYTTAAYTLSGTLAEYGTGHISNGAPTTFVTEQNVTAVSVVLSNIIPSRPEDQARFNKILIFRNILAGSGGVLFPLDENVGMLNNVGTAPLTFTDRFDDSHLLQFGGFSEPTVLNNKPPKFAHQGYWDGRVFGSPVDDPSAVLFSGDLVQILFGVPEECYPSNNILRIPSDDGRVTGMRLMGPLLIITTERYAYFPVGTGDGRFPYRLARFSTLMQGVGDKQMTEFAGTTTDDSDLMLYVGKDKRFFLTAPSVGNVTISDPVQDAFQIGTSYDRVRIANISIGGNHYLLASNVSEGWSIMAYDWDRKVWTNQNVQVPAGTIGETAQPQAFCTVFGSTVPIRFLFIVKGTIYEWLGDSNTLGTTGPARSYVETMPLGGDRKARHRLQGIRAYVSDATKTWQALISINEKTQYVADLIEYPDQLTTIQPSGGFPIDNPNAKELMFVPASDPNQQLDGYRFQVRILFPDDADIRELYCFELLMADEEPPDQTSI